MQKITLKITYDHLAVVLELLQENTDKSTVQKRVVYDILQQLYKKLLKKEIDKRGVKKPFTITIPYYEAYALHEVAQHGTIVTEVSTNPFEWNACHIIKNQIHKQL